MHYGFNLALERRDLSVLPSVVEKHKTSIANKVVDLQSYIMRDGSSICADLIAKHLFPQMNCDVFISHSFDDQDLAIQLAHELKLKGVQAFVDSVFWGSAYDLLRSIDNKYSKRGYGADFDYERCNRSAAHVHMILAAALQKMIMQASTLLFLNTDNSVSTKDFIQGKSMTHSPWIHMELMFSHMIWKLEQRDNLLEAAMESLGSAAPIIHTAPVEHLKSVSSSRFMSWLKARPNRDNPTEFNTAIHSFYTNPNRVW